MKKILLGLLMLVLSATAASAEPKSRVITLKDGSTVQGKIMGIDNGSYVIDSPTLGELKVKESDVVSMVSADSLPAARSVQPGVAASEGDIQAVQAKMMADPAVMAEIQAIASDPEVIALVSDPAFMQAAQAKDAAAIQANPRTAELMNNPKVKALIEKMQAANAR